MNDQSRVTQTINRLISNLPSAIDELKALRLTSLARQLKSDLENLEYWQNNGGLKENLPVESCRFTSYHPTASFRDEQDFCNCNQINWCIGPHHEDGCPMYGGVR